MNAKKPSLKSQLKNSIFKNILLIIASGLIFLFVTMLLLTLYTRSKKSVDVPQVKGLQIKEAKVLLKAQGLKLVVVDSLYDKNATPGAIIEQVPSANSRTKAGREVFLTIYTNNPPEIIVPGLVDYSYRQAVALLTSMGFEQIAVREVPSEYKGLVKAVEFRGRPLQADEKVPSGSPLTIIVGSGMETDSLSFDNEYIVSPDELNQVRPEQKSESNSQKQKTIDESFF